MKKLFPIAAFIAVALASLTMAGFAYFATQEAARIKFQAIADDALNRIESRIDLHLSLLRATKALFDSQGGVVSSKEFETFFDSLDVADHFAGLHGIGLLRVVKAGDEAAVEQEMSRNLGGEPKIHPQSHLPWRAPTMMLAPVDDFSKPVIGFDMMVDPVRRQAIEQAIDDDQEHATARLLLGRNTGSSRSFTGFLVFTRLTSQMGQDGAEAPGTGLIYNAFRSQDLFETALAVAPLLPVNVEIYDQTANSDSLLFRSESPPVEAVGAKLLDIRTIVVAGRQWVLQFRPTSAFSPPSSRAIPIMLGLFGLLLAGAIALVARYQMRAYDVAAQLHETTEKSLLEKELMLQEMKHRIKNLIARVLAIARQTASGATNVKEFSDSFSARLQAMAASQDMLTRSRWQKADLGNLLKIELGQVFGKDLPEDLLSGPRVLLDETATQALGLTFHELATNALKYGEAGNSDGALKVEWRTERLDRARMLVLDWREGGQSGLAEPAKTGFGTKLIDMNITRELNGTIERRFRPDGLQVEIRIPLR
ncbi:histidine kinase [Mesorhizobium sp. Root157]|uniref:CHASE domain-containing protein n=1 Tax=Mesorhizobium sp. Root157 TaxID=1736477 RepID=UPI0006F7929D|nr:CHASE domain-containing protein [Mesorhizobium sp. Root157]KQZ80869.1 histidine kinase [Mesorhizobium sp. Root157]